MIDQIDMASAREPQRRMTHREIHLKDLTAIVGRHWLLVALLSALVGVAAYYSGHKTIPQYRSNLTVQISSAKQVFARLDDIDLDEMALRTDPILSEALVLTTHGLAERVVRSLQLQLSLEDPTLFRGNVMTGVAIDTAAQPGSFTLAMDDDSYQLFDVASNSIDSGTTNNLVTGPGFSFLLLPHQAPLTFDFQIARPELAARAMTGRIAYQVRSGTNAVDIWYTGTDPTLVPLVLNNAATELRDMGVQRAGAAARSRRRYIEEQLAVSDSAYQQSLRDLQRFKEGRQITDLSSQQNAVVQTIRQLEQDRQLALVRVATIRDAMGATDEIEVETLHRLAAIEGIGSNAALNFQIQSLLRLYEERRTLTAGSMGLRESNPQVSGVDAQIRQGHEALQSAVDAAINSIEARVRALQSEIAQRRAELRTFPGMETQIGQLNLESTILSETHRYLLGQYQSARMQEATITPYVTILDVASPAFRTGTSLRQRVVLGLLVGLLLGLAGAFFLEYLDQTVKSSADIERVLGIPVLGMIPHDPKLSPRSNGRRPMVVTIDHLDSDEPAVESYRALRTNVTFVGAERPLQYITVTSPGPREGKSTTAINLSVTLAQSGRRTILLDGDLRRSSVHRSFGLVQEPGLTDVLVGAVGANEAIRPEVAPNLDLLPSGSTPPNPSELLGSSAMDALIAELRHKYEYIIMDTPPTLPVTDAAVVATNADATILVVRSGDTEESAAQRAKEQLQRVRARIAGAVLNAVSAKKDPQYMYYSYRREVPARSRLKIVREKVAGIF